MTPTAAEHPNSIRSHLLAELAQLAPWLADDARPEPLELFGSLDGDEWLIRLAGFTMAALSKHRVDQRGRCAQCQPVYVGWRARIPHWPSKNPCLVWKAARGLLAGPAELAWWQTLALSGHRYDLSEIRGWLDTSPANHPRPAPRARAAARDSHDADDITEQIPRHRYDQDDE